ncbi:MAG: FitA-like ribbon-helix-helix domain-containing protein [Egibacteraceae bacterium]
MLSACNSVEDMSRMIQVRNVPDDLHRALKVRAAQAGLTLTDYVLRELTQIAARPTLEQVLAGIDAEPTPALSETPAEAVRAERRARA